MHLNPGKPPSSPANLGKNLRNRRRRRFLGPFPGFHLFGGTRSAPFGIHRETIIDSNNNKNDDRKDVQPYPVDVWPETGPVVGRSSSGEQLYPYQVAVVLGRGKLAKIEVALTRWEEYQVKLLGERLRKEDACRGLDIRAAKFVSRLSEFQASEFQTKDRMLQWIDEVLTGERLLKGERAKKAKTARARSRGEGKSRSSERGGTIGN
jgi:hypothetical protein